MFGVSENQKRARRNFNEEDRDYFKKIQIKDADENMQAPTMFHQIRWREKASFLFFYNGRPH